MISGIGAGSQWLYTSGGSSGGPYVNMTNPSAGMVRFNGTMFEVYDGSSWLSIGGGYTTVDLSGDAKATLEWAKKKMNDEMEAQRLAKDNVTVADALARVDEANEQLKVIVELVKEHQ